MSDVPPTPPTRGPLRARLLSIALRGGAIALGGIAVLICGFTLGWTTATGTVVANSENPDPQVVEVPISSISDDVSMPDVRGLDPDGAMQVLADSGIDVAGVVTTARPAAGESGVIIGQVPAFGTIRPTQVELVVSATTTMPSLVGHNEEDAMTTLRDLSARVDRVGVYLPGEPVGLVVATSPASGELLPAGVTLTITEAPAAVSFTNLASTGSCAGTDAIEIDGKQWPSGVNCPSSASGRSSSWALEGALEVVSGTIGVLDGLSSDAAARVQILADGVVLDGFDLTSGMSRQFEIDVSGVTTLSITVTTLSAGSVSVGIGDFSGLGTAAKIDRLQK